MKRRVEGTGTIRTEGGLLTRDLLERVAAGDKSLAGMVPDAYHLAPNEKLGEAITRSWNRLVGAWEAFSDIVANLPLDERTGTTITRQRWSLLLFQELGFGQLQTARAVEIGDKSYPVSHAWDHVPIHLVGVRVDLDRRTPGVAGAATMSPHSLVQELVNRTDEHLWAIVTNGLRLRLLRDNVALTRQAYVEFDLEAMFTGQAYADFALLWLVCHQSRFEADIPAKCLLEQWTLEANERGTRALDQLRVGVEAAITALGEGFLAHPANAQLRQSLEGGKLEKQDYYRQLLRTVYRLLFLFVAEGRDLLLDPGVDTTARERYRSFYSLFRLRALADARRGSTHGDQWAGLQLVMQALGENGAPALGLPALGSFLWKPQATPHLDGARLDNRHVLTAIRSLSMTTEGGVTRSVDYRNLGAEELGSIYESLLELHPVVDVAARTFALSTAGGNERKTTGSYYTPTSLITELLDSALEPVLDEAASAADPEAALLAVTVLDPACGSGHFLIAAAHRIAKRLASVRSGDGEPAPPLVQEALREVVATCVHGIDVNEMAVELCKVSLWMEAMVPGKPLAFLEHRIVCGNALFGATPELLAAGVPDDAFKPLEGDDRAIVTALRKRNKQEREGQGALLFGPSTTDFLPALSGEMAAIDAMPDDTLTEVQAKERRWLALQHSSDVGRAQFAADAWCAAFVSHKTMGSSAVTDAFVRQTASHDQWELDQTTVREVVRIKEQYRFLHLHLAFPDIFGSSSGAENAQARWTGGFTLVLGNPPWERVKLQEKEWFATRSPEIAGARNASTRKALIKRLADDDPSLLQEFHNALRKAEGESHFLRTSGRYPLCGRGDVNTYTVFAEGMRAAVAPQGRAGIIVPSGIATDDTTKTFFSDLVSSKCLVSLFDFSNAGFFADVAGAQGNRFCLLTLTGRQGQVESAEFVFFARSVAELREEERRFRLSADDFALLNPNTLTCPVFRGRRDAELTRQIYRRVPVLLREGDNQDNPWGVKFETMFHMANDSSYFRSRQELEEEGATLHRNIFERGDDRWLPLYEAKMFHHFDHRFGDFSKAPVTTKEVRQIPSPGADELEDPAYEVQPRYWVTEQRVREVSPTANWLLAFRDITSAVDFRTVIAAGIPSVAVGHTAPILHVAQANATAVSLIGNLTSFALDYVARQKVGGVHLTYFLLKQLPVLPPATFGEDARWDSSGTVGAWVNKRVLELVYTTYAQEPIGRACGWDGAPFVWDSVRRELNRVELDACFFHLYGIERHDADYIMETFSIVKRKDAALFGEYRTKRLILEVYDAMAEAIASGRSYETVLDPPPADPSLCHPESTRPEWANQP